METYRNCTILIKVTDVNPPLSGKYRYCGQVERIFNLETEKDEHPGHDLHIHHAETKSDAEALAIQEAKEWIDLKK